MIDHKRPDPDKLLDFIDYQDKKNRRGNLRLFLGMSAGVGKTYTMLKAAHQKKDEGVDVVIGYVETHNRKETASLIDGLEVIPRKKINYRETSLEEMDIDAVLQRRPKLVIVDELAHTNAPSSRNEKRYQDILELIDNGIDVFTALNVQHLESRKDAVEAITQVTIRETVPDRVLDDADQVELVDISPDELLKRLKEGKIYLGDKAERAAQNFFKEDTLTALREISLRLTAERVDQDLQKFVSLRTDEKNWQTNDRLLVAISHSPYSQKLIRATRRLAYNLEASWIALYVDTGITLNDVDQAQLVKNLNLAKELNAELITTTDVDVTSAINRICQQKNVSQVVVGRSTRRWFRDIIDGGSLLNRLVSENPYIDLHVLRHDGTNQVRPKIIDEISYYRSRTGLRKYIYTIWTIIGLSILNTFFEQIIGYRSVGFIFLLGVMIIGMFGSIGAVVLAATMSAIVWDYFFIPPRFTFAISNPEDILMSIAFFVVAMITGFLANRIKFHEKVIRDREYRTNVLYQILQDIANATEKSEFLHKVCQRTGSILAGKCGVILKDNNHVLDFSSLIDYQIQLSEKDQAVAQWSFEKNKSVGWSTETLSESSALYLPLRGTKELVGVFIFQPTKRIRKIDLEKQNLLNSIVSQLGVSIERHFLAKKVLESQRLKDSEQLHQTLLNSISHELRTPLTTILGTASALDNDNTVRQHHYLLDPIKDIQLAGQRLNQVIENLLDMSRLNSGVMTLKIDWHDVNDLLNVILKKYELQLHQHKIELILSDQLILLKIDFRLMEHAISNILLNAAAYSPPHTKIQIKTVVDHNYFYLHILDEGKGIPSSSVPFIFNKFYRVPGSPSGGTGLGLSIVKSIVELHHGQVYVDSDRQVGSEFVIQLPLQQLPTISEES